MAVGKPEEVAPETAVHRIGGGSVENLRLKPREAMFTPAGISVLLGGTPAEAAEQMRQAFPDPTKYARIWAQTHIVGSATASAIRQVGFELLPDPSAKFPNHARLTHPEGRAGFSDTNLTRLAGVFQDPVHPGGITMLLRPEQPLTLWDAHEQCLGRVVIDRIEGNLVFGQFRPEPNYARVQSLFADYIEAANEQLLSIVGELDEAIAALRLHLRAADGSDLPAIHDVQIGAGRITFRLRTHPPEGLKQNGRAQQAAGQTSASRTEASS
jgi:hypothetical protein